MQHSRIYALSYVGCATVPSRPHTKTVQDTHTHTHTHTHSLRGALDRPAHIRSAECDTQQPTADTVCQRRCPSVRSVGVQHTHTHTSHTQTHTHTSTHNTHTDRQTHTHTHTHATHTHTYTHKHNTHKHTHTHTHTQTHNILSLSISALSERARQNTRTI